MRAEFIRLHVRLAEQPESGEFFRLLSRERELRQDVASAWLGALGYQDAYPRLFDLDKGFLLESPATLLGWGTTNDELTKCGAPERPGDGWFLSWPDCVFWRGLRGSVAATVRSKARGFFSLPSLSWRRHIPTQLENIMISRRSDEDENSGEVVNWQRELTLRFGPPLTSRKVQTEAGEGDMNEWPFGNVHIVQFDTGLHIFHGSRWD